MEHLINWFDKFSNKIFQHFSDPEYQELCILTSFLDGHYKVKTSQRIWHLRNNNFEIQKCEVCGNPAEWKTNGSLYKNFCQECVNKTEFTPEELVQYFMINHYTILNNEHFKIKFYSLTSFLDDVYDKIVPSQRMWHIQNNCYEIQKCKICGNPASWSKDIYSVVCNKDCKQEYLQTQEYKDKIKNTNLERYGVENYSQTKECVEKIKKTNLQRYGVEHTSQLEESKEKSKKTSLERYGVEHPSKTKSVKEKYKATCLERYGVESYTQTQEHKNKQKLTCLKKYGVDSYSKTQEWKDKTEQTCLERYGVDSYSKTQEWKDKSKQTCLKKHGVENYCETEEYKEKYKATCLERYGVESYSQTQEHKNKRKLTCLKKYGVESYSQTQEHRNTVQKMCETKFEERLIKYPHLKLVEKCFDKSYLIHCDECDQDFRITSDLFYHREKMNNEICTVCNPVEKFYSSSEKELLSFIQSIYSGIIIENTKSVIPPYELDIFLPELSLAIEFNGLYWHCSEQKPDNYHKTKTELCEQKGIRLVHIFEDDWNFGRYIVKSILQTAIKPELNIRIQARKCRIEEMNLQQTNDFLEQNHIQGSVLTQTVCYGLYYNGVLVSLMSFKKSGRGFELQRYGILLFHVIVGGAEKLFKHFLKEYDPEFVITYADISLFTGKIYQKLGFTKVRRNKPNYMFVDGFIRIPKQSIRKLGQGYKRENDPYPRIYNCGIDKWEWKKPT